MPERGGLVYRLVMPCSLPEEVEVCQGAHDHVNSKFIVNGVVAFSPKPEALPRRSKETLVISLRSLSVFPGPEQPHVAWYSE